MGTANAYAGRAERFLAYLIDAILLLVPVILIVDVMGMAHVVILMSFLISLTYYTYFTASRWQATPGKRLLGLHVAHADGRAMGVRDALERYLAFVLPSLPLNASFIPENIAQSLVLGLSVLWFSPILFTEERIGLHDRLCGTRVLAGRT